MPLNGGHPGRRPDVRLGLPRLRSSPRSPRTSSAVAARARRRRALAAVVALAVRDPARAARGAAPALDRRVDVLGLRPHRRRARRRTRTRDAPADVPGRSGVPVRRDGLARHDDRLRPGVHARLRAARARGRHVRRRGRVDLQVASPRVAVLACCGSAPRASRAGRALALAFVGWNPLLARALRAAAATTTRGWRCSCSARSRCGRAAAAARRRRLGGRRCSSSGCRSCCCRCARSRRARRGRRVGHWRLRGRGGRRRRCARSRATGPAGCTRSARSRGTRTTRRAASLPHRLEQLGVPHGACDRALRARVRRRVRVARSRGVARPRAARPRDVRAAARVPVSRRLVRRVGRPARRGRGRRAGGAARARPLRVPAARRRFRSRDGRTRRKTSTPSCSKTSRHAGFAPQPDDLRRRRQRREPVGVAGPRLVDGDPRRVLDVREAEHPPARGEVRAERVRRADGSVRRDQRERPRRRPGRARSRAPRATAATRRAADSSRAVSGRAVVADQRTPRARSTRPARRPRSRTRAPPSTAAATSGGMIAAV